MGFDMRPLSPSGGDCGGRESCLRMPLFGCESCCSRREACGCSQSVRLENPSSPGEYAEVSLSVDSCGNLVVCVHRDYSCGCKGKRRCY